MILSGRTQMMSEYTVPVALEHMSALGLDSAEVCVESLDFTIRPELFDRVYLEEVSAAAHSLGMKNWSYSYHAD